jgi:hypothetical protein
MTATRAELYGVAECMADDGRVLAHHTLWYSRTGSLLTRSEGDAEPAAR